MNLKMADNQLLELLKIFSAAKSCGRDAVLILETRNGTLSTKYRSWEREAGAPVTPSSPCPPRRKVTPARARRSQLRLERFMKNKIEEKAGATAENAVENEDIAGNTSNVLVIELNNSKNLQEEVSETGNISPIVQVDGNLDHDEEISEYTFTSNYAEEDIAYTLEKNCYLDSYVQSKPRSADHLCTIRLKDPTKKFIWPTMNSVQRDVIKDLKKFPE